MNHTINKYIKMSVVSGYSVLCSTVDFIAAECQHINLNAESATDVLQILHENFKLMDLYSYTNINFIYDRENPEAFERIAKAFFFNFLI